MLLDAVDSFCFYHKCVSSSVEMWSLVVGWWRIDYFPSIFVDGRRDVIRALKYLVGCCHVGQEAKVVRKGGCMNGVLLDWLN